MLDGFGMVFGWFRIDFDGFWMVFRWFKYTIKDLDLLLDGFRLISDGFSHGFWMVLDRFWMV